MRKPREEEYNAGSLCAMIDVVFQLIIFFVCTINMQDKAIDDSIHLARAPHGVQVTKKDPLEINIDIDSRGRISIARTQISPAMLKAIVRKAIAEHGVNRVPIILRGDQYTRHSDIQVALNACTEAGNYKFKFAAFKEKNTK